MKDLIKISITIAFLKIRYIIYIFKHTIFKKEDLSEPVPIFIFYIWALKAKRSFLIASRFKKLVGLCLIYQKTIPPIIRKRYRSSDFTILLLSELGLIDIALARTPFYMQRNLSYWWPLDIQGMQARLIVLNSFIEYFKTYNNKNIIPIVEKELQKIQKEEKFINITFC